MDVIRAQASIALSDGDDLRTILGELAPALSDEGRTTVLKAAVMVAVADGELGAGERPVLAEIADALGMTADDMRRVVSELG